MHINIIVYLYLLLTKTTTQAHIHPIIVLDKGLYPVEKGSIGLLFYVDIENIHPWYTCSIHSWPKMCCLEDDPFIECYTDIIYGDNIESIIPKRRETLIYVYPTLYQHDQVGYCNFIIDLKCGRMQRLTKQLDIRIPFSTKLKSRKYPAHLKTYSSQKWTNCKSLDEDILNDCAPVECDLKYSGRRSYFDTRRRKCISPPDCKTNIHKELPDIVYVPKSNTCRDLDVSITPNDIYDITKGLVVVTNLKNNSQKYKNEVQVVTNCSTISQNLILLKDLMTGKLCPLFKDDASSYSDCCKSALLSIFACLIIVSALLMSITCCIYSLIWLFQKIRNKEMLHYFKTYDEKKSSQELQKRSRLARDITNNLLKEVIVRDLPLELRDSVVDICDRINIEVGRKKRYRMMDLGNQINLLDADSDTTFASSSGRSLHGEDD